MFSIPNNKDQRRKSDIEAVPVCALEHKDIYWHSYGCLFRVQPYFVYLFFLPLQDTFSIISGPFGCKLICNLTYSLFFYLPGYLFFDYLFFFIHLAT